MKPLALTTALILAALPAFAQEAPYSQTLDEQLARLRAGRTAVPTVAEPPAPMPAYAPSAAPSGEMIDSRGGDAIPALPLQVFTTGGGIRYITGGIGEEENAQLRAVQADYNVQMLIAATGGAYLSGASVRALDALGRELISATGCGPYFYTSLPAGSYTFEIITQQGNQKILKIKVPASGTVKPAARFAE